MPRALASRATPQKFNLEFNKKPTNCGSEENLFSYFSNVEEERPIELCDYFSDDEEENDTCDQEDQKSEDFYQWNPIISSLETIHEPDAGNHKKANQFNPISGFSEEARLGFSTWQAFIPLDHAFQNYAAQSPPLDFLSPASSLQEPTLAKISTISTPTKQTSSPTETISPRLKVPLYIKLRETEFQDLSKPPSQRRRAKPCKPFYSPTYSATPTPRQPSFTNSPAQSAILNHEPQDHPERSTRFKLWKQHLQDLTSTNKS